ncbi:hypothetical protein LT337_10210 [Mycolicibacterium fortuitum]|nr:hypothetical protein LT337_10210 [Mycolicibacterium fortuitum]
MSDERYDPSATVQVATVAAPAGQRPARVGYVPTRTNRVRDGLAVVLLVVAMLLPWNLEFGVGVPGSAASTFVMLAIVTLLAIAAALAPHLGPFRLGGGRSDVRRTSRVRLVLSAAYLLVVVCFVGYHVAQTVRGGGTGAVPRGWARACCSASRVRCWRGSRPSRRSRSRTTSFGAGMRWRG